MSLLRIAATLAVVFLHTNNTLSNNSEQFFLTKNQMVFFTTNNLLMNWAVPVFLMITGVLLLDPNRQIPYSDCIKKYARRILLALFVFGIPFSMLEILLNTKSITVNSFFEATINVINGNSWSHLWYLYALIGLYFILPMLKAFVNNSDEETLLYLIGVIFIFSFVIKSIDKVSGTTIAFAIPITGFTIFYVLAGRYITIIKSRFLDKKSIGIGVLVFTIVIVVIGSICYFPKSKELLGYNSPMIAFLSIVVFCLFMGAKSEKTELLWRIDRLCFGVYLIHPVFINITYKFLKLTPVTFGGFYSVATFVFWMFFVASSFAGAWIMYQIPILKKYIL
ncbi:acyltransferase family protein [Erysipelotrichaceae bacterium 66202529]|nr:acyltransferase family protein [Erysipelotrichaceae bacterium 66202529]